MVRTWRGARSDSFAAAIMLALALATAPARAALFDDDEARKRVDALRVRVDQLEQQLSQRLERLEAKDAALVDMFRDVEQIKADIARLRGQYEVLAYELEQAQKRQHDLYLDLDGRLRKIEGGPGAAAANPDAAPTIQGGAATASPAALARARLRCTTFTRAIAASISSDS